MLADIELSSGRIRAKDEIPPSDKLSDLKRGKLINDVKELDLDAGIPMGSGASGRVTRVLHKPSGQFVAVKKIPIHDEHLRREILKELHLLYHSAGGFGSKAIIDNDLIMGTRYIIKFHGAFFHAGAVLIALECMVGSLDDALQICGTIPEEVLRAITWQAVSALYYLNKAHHIHHRDIKSANLLLGKDGRVRVSDFGVASDEKMQTMTPANTFVGTVIYMSPERLKGQEYGINADIWSLGLVLLFAATGMHPFRNLDMYGIMMIEQNNNVPELPREKFSPDFVDFVKECMELDPHMRPNSEEMKKHKWISNMTEGRSERLILEWSDPIVTQLEMKRANAHEEVNNFNFDQLDSQLNL
mmetsp:Transcript_54293/g.90514  ORF Transcript_54293/g.90514 Transcript_54293/m.90514 type:complete len:358 (+) Transcript_54293:636-1709(+)